MSYRQWRNFRNDLVDILTYRFGGTIVFATLGVSHSDWGKERSYTIGVTGISLESWRKLEIALSHLAFLYDQDAIAVTAADPLFISREA